ncbi:RNA 2'-phosphotransferase, Tpt1 [Whalleya microplaca]|nr:RNA 2'-phosphotransferase, Tpt1 [Whalleya microplaca]
MADSAEYFDDAAAEILESRAVGRRGGGKGGKNGGARRGGGGGGGQGREVLISKALSTLLRHQVQNAGIALDAEGFAPLDRVMQWPRLRSLNPTFAEIRQAVDDNAKQRFSMKPNPKAGATADDDDPAAWLIRANQGHSIAVADEGLHTPLTLEGDAKLPDIVVHGTYFAFWPSIEAAGGLKKMGRQHVHFGTGLPDSDAGSQVHDEADEKTEGEGEKGKGKGTKEATKVISGMRGDAEVLVFVDLERSLRDGGIKWWLSSNGVVLTEGNEDGVVPLRYFKEVRGRRQGVGVLWRDGEKVADLPPGIVARVPMGKNRAGFAGGGGGGGAGGAGGEKRGGSRRRGGRGGKAS